MGGLGPGIGGFELVVIGLVALLVVGPKDLPVLMRRVGQMVAKARAMANEFRSSFDEMARQSELDELRKEVEALRSGQGPIYPLGAEADAAFKDINAGLVASPGPPSAVTAPVAEEWPDHDPQAAAPAVVAEEAVPAAGPTKPKPTSRTTKSKAMAADAKPFPKPRTSRKKAAES